MALMTTARSRGRLDPAAREADDVVERAESATSGSLEALVTRVLDCPDGVSDDVIAEAVRGLEAMGGGSLGETAGDARVLLQRRFGRALGRSDWTGGGA